jgi:UDP-glucose:(heptosyl)LPS alpha-1,3-glucosyltransferase
MKLAFCIPKYFPYGGLQRDFMRIARRCLTQGHQIVVYTLIWEGEIPEGFEVHVVPLRAIRNHSRNAEFIEKTRPLLFDGGFDGVIGFLKMPGLDIYYAADPCYQLRTRERSWLYRTSARYRHFVEFERAVFRADGRTEILMLTEAEIANYIDCYGTPPERFHLLPPGIERDRMAPVNAAEIRAGLHRELGVVDQDNVLLLIGSNYRLKGLGRALRALASLAPALRTRTRLLVLGDSDPKPFQRLARRLNIAKHVHFLGAREDVPRFLLGSDLLIHPAYSESGGMVLLEAMVAGLPVLTTASCGYAFHVTRAGAGTVLPLPFRQAQLNDRLGAMLSSPERPVWSRNGIDYGRTADLYSLPETATATIMNLLERRRR